jgi:hypothetical protein
MRQVEPMAEVVPDCTANPVCVTQVIDPWQVVNVGGNFWTSIAHW